MTIYDEYHPHYPSVDKDYNQRLYENAHKIANPFRLMCGKYSEAEEQALYDLWQAAKKKTGMK